MKTNKVKVSIAKCREGDIHFIYLYVYTFIS